MCSSLSDSDSCLSAAQRSAACAENSFDLALSESDSGSLDTACSHSHNCRLSVLSTLSY